MVNFFYLIFLGNIMLIDGTGGTFYFGNTNV